MPDNHPPKIIHHSPLKYALLLLSSLSFTIGSYWLDYTFGLVFFGLCALVFTYPLLNPRNKLVFTGTKAYKQLNKDDFELAYNTLGLFIYSETGFAASLNGKTLQIRWEEVQAIYGYRYLDCYTGPIDSLDIFYKVDSWVCITQNTDGWYQFLIRLHDQFSSMPVEWGEIIDVPIPEATPVLLYERNELSSLAASAKYYPSSLD